MPSPEPRAASPAVGRARLVLASASPARRGILAAAGIDAEVMVSEVDEDAALAHAQDSAGALGVADQVLVLAQAKAAAVAARLDETEDDADEPRGPRLVLGCDSLLEFDGEAHGKPGATELARERWQRMRGRSGVLHTGHWLVGDTGEAGATASTLVHFADVSDAEIDAYLATGEPLAVAGAFTIDSLGGAFVRGVEGDHHAVIGLSLPLLRTLVARLGVTYTDLWARPGHL